MQNRLIHHLLFQQLPRLGADFISFQQDISELAIQMKLDLAKYEIDHLALRVNNLQTAKNWLTALLKCGRILSDNVINGRPIYLIELDEPLLFFGQQVKIIELPFPKDKQYPQQTWEHIEVVMPFLPDEQVQDWINRIKNQFLWNELSLLTVKVGEPKGDGERLPNPSIAISFLDKTKNFRTIKVHPYSIKNIIEV